MKSHSEQLEELQKLSQQISRDRELLKVDQEYLDNAPLNLKVALSHLKQAEQDKELLDAEIVLTQTNLREEKLKTELEMTKLGDELSIRILLINKEEDILKKLELSTKDAQKKLNAINDESGTRKRYLAEQEKIITHLMEEANESIAQAHTEFSHLERSIAGLEVQKTQFESDIQTLLLDRNALEGDTILLQEKNEQVYEEALINLKEVKKKVTDTEVKYTQMVQDIDKRKSELHAEVEAIDAKREALFNENHELETRKRRSMPIEDYKL